VPVVLRRLTSDDSASLASLWQEANNARRESIGLSALPEAEPVLARAGAFGVGIFDGDLVSAAVALPARGDDGRSQLNVPGLAHISSVMTAPNRWGDGLAGRVVEAVMSAALRRGYSRAQLWTHLTNGAAQRVYEREGFWRSGRERPDDNGEPMAHYLCDLPVLQTRSRPAARLLCLDASDRLLLLHFRDPHDGHLLWEPPGGGIEPGESPREAVIREWAEETGLPLPALAPESTYVARDIVWRGSRWVVDEHFFLARMPGVGPPIPSEGVDQELDAYLGSDWVPWRNVGALPDPATPDVVPVLRRLDPSGPWASPSSPA
jgi:8-oxo-dGTP pyrophosphatase MutT (NUDIX family)/GNAT superfamily N-acetyltransferase